MIGIHFKQSIMNNRWILFTLAILLLVACGPKAVYETRDGKKKLEHYNKLQFGQRQKR